MKIKFAYSTYPSHKGFYAAGIKKRPHRYGPRTAHGERVVWKEYHHVTLGDFPTRADAIAAGKRWKMEQLENAKG